VKQRRENNNSGFAKLTCKIPIQCIGKNMLHTKNNSLLFTKEDSSIAIGDHDCSKQNVTRGFYGDMPKSFVDLFLKSVGTDFAYFSLR
jgi:hypothetical protein